MYVWKSGVDICMASSCVVTDEYFVLAVEGEGIYGHVVLEVSGFFLEREGVGWLNVYDYIEPRGITVAGERGAGNR